jgi:DNA-binding transcriptional regulator YdaS (Cro superfamily)
MSQLNFLIEKAASVAGSEYKLAQTLGVQQSVIYTWKTGKRTCSPTDRAAIADVAGMNPAAEALEGVLEGIDVDTPKGQRAAKALREALNRITSL